MAQEGKPRQVLLLSSSPQAVEVVSRALRSAGGLLLRGTCETLKGLEEGLRGDPVPAVLVDIDPDPHQMIQCLGSLVSRHDSTRFVVLSSVVRNELILEAMQAGARHFMAKDDIDKELAPSLERLLSNGHAKQSSRGSIITVMSAGGGCGATTLVVNLANELHLEHDDPVLLVDLDPTYGAVAEWLGLTGEFGIADVLNHDTDDIDDHLIRSSAVHFHEKIHVLLSPASVQSYKAVGLNYNRLEGALVAFRDAYRFTVMDAPRLPVDVTGTLACGSDAVLVVMQLSVKDIHVAKRTRAILVDRGTDADRILYVVNRYHKRDLIAIDEARTALGDGKLVCLSNDYRSANLAGNFGQPLAEAAKSSTLRSEVRGLAMEIVDLSRERSKSR